MDKIAIAKVKRIFSALDNENRVMILFLCEKKGLTITELSKILKLNYTITSEYVSQLHCAGLVGKERNKDKTVTIRSLFRIGKGGELLKI